MTYDEIMNEIEKIYEDCRENGGSADERIEALLKEKCHIVRVMCPHLGKNLRPHPELCNPDECPNNKDGNCGDCDNFVCYKSDTGEVFAFMAFTGYCLKEGNNET